MSAFILQTKGFDQLGNILYDYANGRSDGRKRAVRMFLFNDWKQAYNAKPEEVKKQLQLRINNLISANYHAVNERYNEDSEPEYYEFSYHTIPVWSDVQVIKHLQCLRYQMSEGDMPGREIYKLLSQLIADLCESYVDSSPRYEAASWGW